MTLPKERSGGEIRTISARAASGAVVEAQSKTKRSKLRLSRTRDRPLSFMAALSVPGEAQCEGVCSGAFALLNAA